MQPSARYSNDLRFTLFLATVLCLASCTLLQAEEEQDSAASGNYECIPLAPYYNADIFTHFESRTDGQVDTGRASFPAEMMPASGNTIRTGGIPFVFPSKQDGANNAVRCSGQVLELVPQSAEYLYLLATAADGNQRTHVTLTHDDGTTYRAAFDVNDWCAENPGLGAIHGLVSDYRHTLGGKQHCKTSIWLIPVRLRSVSPLISITLPENPNVYVIAATLGPAGEERRLQTFVKEAFFPSHEKGIDRLVLLQIVEPQSNAQLQVLADDGWSGNFRVIDTHDLKAGMQSVPIRLPLGRGRTYALEINGKEYGYLDETNLMVNAPEALIRVRATRPAHPADADLGMAPAWQITALPDTAFQVDIHIPEAPSDTMDFSAVISSTDTPDGGCRILSAPLQTTVGRPDSLSVKLEPESLPPGRYDMACTLRVDSMPWEQTHYQVTVIPEAQANRPFGARVTNLGYAGPVWTNWDKAISWEQAWQDFEGQDIVIDFPGQPYRYVFWKGASYAPIWLFDRSFITLEWLEGWPRQEGAVDCVEPLQDKECKYSRIELLSSTPARARVLWTYAETDFNLKIIHGEHAAEIYTMYPDGIGVRKVIGYFEKGRWHECCEFITGSVAGTTPAEHYPPQALSILDCSTNRLDLYWPTPQESGLPEWREYIGIAHARNHPGIFLACEGKDTGLHVFSNNPDWLSEMFFCMPHWPIQRGLPTTNERSIEDCYVRPTHASLMNFYARPWEIYPDHTIWALLIGVSPDNTDELRETVRGWLYPPVLERQPDRRQMPYDIYQRGYVIDMQQTNRCSLRLRSDPQQPQIRPAMILTNIPEVTGCSVTIDGRRLTPDNDYAFGFENYRQTAVLWLNTAFRQSADIEITLTDLPGEEPAADTAETLPTDKHALRTMIAGWIEPPALDVIDGAASPAVYDYSGRGYRLTPTATARSLRVRLQAGNSITYPALLIENREDHSIASVQLDGHELREGQDYTRHGQVDGTLVIRINRTLKKGAELEVRFQSCAAATKTAVFANENQERKEESPHRGTPQDENE